MLNTLKPFFCFYGGKWRAAPFYPKPNYDCIIEPFAGAAGYATRYHDRQVILYDTDPVIAGLWEYLSKVRPTDIMSLPIGISHIDEVNCCQEAKWLIGFWLNKGMVSPCLTPSKWMRAGAHLNSFWGEAIRYRIASQVNHIRHWKVFNKPYNSAEKKEATWFIDPPYNNKAGMVYRKKFHDYEGLSVWCKSRLGQTIVCENEGARWLDFQPFKEIKSTEGSRGKSKSKEVIWTNELGTTVPTQQGLFDA